jgi:hypothetical protein
MLNADESSGGELVRFDKKDDNEEKERRAYFLILHHLTRKSNYQQFKILY